MPYFHETKALKIRQPVAMCSLQVVEYREVMMELLLQALLVQSKSCDSTTWELQWFGASGSGPDKKYVFIFI